QGVPVEDILLNNLPTIDIDSFIILSTLVSTLIIVFLFGAMPQYLNFGLKSVSLFIIIRSFFISLTHLGAAPDQLQFDPTNIGYWLYNVLYNTRGDFFFSGHTGIPFLMALIFWPEKKWRYFFFAVSGVLGVGVLLAHIHYSIDVFAAPFMAYGIFSIARYLFKKDYDYIGS
ncbi:MAG: phosphatase PAP2-related protein, partial [Candidatus Falkowbacteria bacterium]|nr:phosphatase PAP2-related protein [Candidatus Falkowbacteria bacterium]